LECSGLVSFFLTYAWFFNTWAWNETSLHCISHLYPETQRLSRLEEVEKNQIETTKRRFFAEILNTVREMQLQIQASLKRRKQRNDGIQVHSFFLHLSFVCYCKRCNQGFASVCLELTSDLFIYIIGNMNIVILYTNYIHYFLSTSFYALKIQCTCDYVKNDFLLL
jgi:hypothetical protein